MTAKNIHFAFQTLLVPALLWLNTATAAPPVKVKVTNAYPDNALQGEGLNVTLSGEGFTAESSVSFLVSGTTDDSQIATGAPFNVNGAGTELTVPIVVDPSALVTDYDIEVRSGKRRGKGTTLFRVQSVNGGGGDQTNTPLKVRIKQLVGKDDLPSSMVYDGVSEWYVHQENVDAVTKSGNYWAGMQMDFHGRKWHGGAGRQLDIHFTCDDSTALGGDCGLLGTQGDIDPTGNGDVMRAGLNLFSFVIYDKSECPLSNDCPSKGMFDMTPGQPELVGMSAIVRSARPFIQLQSNQTIPADCIQHLSPANQQLFMDSCYENGNAPEGAPLCNAIIKGKDLDPGAYNGNDRWRIRAENSTALLCNEDVFIGVTTLSFDVVVVRRD